MIAKEKIIRFKKKWLENHRDHYKKCLDDFEELKRFLVSKIELHEKGLNPVPLEEYIEGKCRLDEVEGLIHGNEYHYETYCARVEEEAPKFEKECQEVNEKFLEVFERAATMAASHRESLLAKLAAGYEEAMILHKKDPEYCQMARWEKLGFRLRR